MTAWGNRCGDCSKFPGNGQRCKIDKMERKRVFMLDYRCDDGDTPKIGD